MASGVYAKGLEQILNGDLDWGTTTVKVMAVKTGYTLDKEAHEFLDDVSASRYTDVTDVELAGESVGRDTVNNWVELNATTTTFPSVALSGADDIIGFIIYIEVGAESADILLFYDDIAVDVTPDGNNVNYNPNASGIAYFTYGA